MEKNIKSREGKSVFIKNMNREELLSLAAKSDDKRIKYDCFELLLKLKNYTAASEAARHLNYDNISGVGKNRIILAYLSSTHGAIANHLLASYSSLIKEKGVAKKEFIMLLDNLHKSNLSKKEKEKVISDLHRHLDLDVEEREILECTAFLIDYDSNNASRPEFFLGRGKEIKSPLVAEKLIPYFFTIGAIEVGCKLLDQMAARRGEFDEKVVRFNAIHRPDWLESVIKSDLSLLNIEEQNFLLALATVRHKNPFFEDMYINNLNNMFERYHSLDMQGKDNLIYTFLHVGEFDKASELSKSEVLPNTFMAAQSALGFKYLSEEKFNASKDIFMGVLKQNPADLVSSQGIRFALPRTGEAMSALINIRQSIGYGIKSGGITGRHNVWSELTISLLMSGEYLAGLYSKRKLPHWVSLKESYGDKFISFEKLPNKKDGSIFIIADDGVGDEIRSSQFYQEIVNRYGKVTATCDPRLFNILTKSFPSIKFLPVSRFRKGVRERANNDSSRLKDLGAKIADYLTVDCKVYMDTSDFLTFGQTLFFNKFSGVLSTPGDGKYLLHTGNYVMPKKIKKRVGILWRSHLLSGWRQFMYMRVEDFIPLTTLENIEIWSIQHAMTRNEIKTCRDNGIIVPEDIDLFDDFDTMSCMLSQMDLLIGISSAPIELGAALGIPVWMLGVSPENYYLRTGGGVIEDDQLTINSKVIAPKWIDFTQSRSTCRDIVMQEVISALQD